MSQIRNYLWLSLLLLAGCGLPTINDRPPAKVEFASDHSTITEGDTVRLSWTSKDASSCTVTANGVVVSSETSGTIDQKPDKTTVYSADCSGKKNGSASLTIIVLKLPVAKITASEAQIYAGNSTELSWSCENSEKANLTVNGEAAAALTLTGASLYSPTADTAYELVCENTVGSKVSAKTDVKVITELAVKPMFPTFAELDQAIDVEALKADCSSACLYADFEPQKYKRGQDGKLLATPDQIETLKTSLTAEVAKVALFTSKTVAFDFPGSFGYGHRDSVNDTAQAQLCDEKFPLGTKGARFPVDPQFIDALEDGTEALGTYRFPDPIAFDVEVSTKAIAGTMKTGTEATVSYKIGGAEGSREAHFQDFDKVKGGFKLDKQGNVIKTRDAAPAPVSQESLRSFVAMLDDVTPRSSLSCSLPGGNGSSVVVSKPAGAVDYQSASAIARTYYPEPGRYGLNSSMYNPFDDLCTKQPWFLMPAVVSAGEPCYYVSAQDIDRKPGFVKPGSPRIASGLGIVQCKAYFPAVASTYSLGDDWTATGELQYFVTDSRYKNGCDGANCAAKEPRTSENDWRFTEVEPAYNKCIDRWRGLPWADYLNRLSNVCTSTQLYKDAVALKAQKDADASFASTCNTTPACSDALGAMSALADTFSPKTLSDILDREVAATQKAQNESRSYFITEPKLAPSLIATVRAQIAKIEAGIDTVLQLHTTKGSGWISANKLVHARASVPGLKVSARALIAPKASLQAGVVLQVLAKDASASF